MTDHDLITSLRREIADRNFIIAQQRRKLDTQADRIDLLEKINAGQERHIRNLIAESEAA